MSAIAWPIAVLSAANVLDNPWNVCVSRAAEVTLLHFNNTFVQK